MYCEFHLPVVDLVLLARIRPGELGVDLLRHTHILSKKSFSSNVQMRLFTQQGRNVPSLPDLFSLLPSCLHTEPSSFPDSARTTTLLCPPLPYIHPHKHIQHFTPFFSAIPFPPSFLLPPASPPPWETQCSVTVVVLPGSCGGDSGSSTQRLE